ncbi:MAG: M28 family peptidase [Ginsengibacter sp.]
MKKLFFSILSLLLLVGTSFAQDDVAWKYAQTITQADLQHQLKIIASADMEGRETGTYGQRTAASYIESQFKKFGLKPAEALNGYQQFYPLHQDTLVPGILKIGTNDFTYGTDYVLSSPTKNVKANEIIFAGYGIDDKNYSDYQDKNVKGKVVLVMSGEPKVDGKYLVSNTDKQSRWGFGSAMKVNAAKEKGAVAVIMVNPAWESIPDRMKTSSLKTNVFYPKEDEGLTVVTLTKPGLEKIVGAKEASEIMTAYDTKGPLNKMNMDKKMATDLSFQKTTKIIGATNVLGYIEGTDLKDQYVFLTAHYDHLGKKGDVIYYGADDDGSGTVSVLEMAEAFSKAKAEGHGPRRTIVFMTVSGEEKGLWGSQYYSDHPVFPMDKTSVDLNTDMIGRLDPNRTVGDSMNYIYVVGDDKLSSELKPISIATNNKYTKMELDYKFNDPADPERIYFRSDHYNFARKGVPIIFYFDGIHKDYHKPTDTWDKINFDVMEKRARFIFLTGWEMANRDEMLKRDIPLDSASR